MAVYSNIEELVSASAGWLANDDPWPLTEWHRRVQFCSVRELPMLTESEKALAWAMGVNWIALPPAPCPVCGSSLETHADSRYELATVFRGTRACCAKPHSLRYLCKAGVKDVARFPPFLIMYGLEYPTETI